MAEETNPGISHHQKSPLILAQFSNGNLKYARKSGLRFTCYKKTEKSMFSKRILVAESSRLQYSGSNYENKMSTISTSVLKVGIRSKSSGKIKLFDLDFFNVKPLLKCQLYKSEEKSFIEQADDLVLAFGSKTKMKLVNSRLKYCAAEEAVQGAARNMDIKAYDAALNDPVNVRPQTNSASAIPPQNENPTSIGDVYNLFDIISENEYVALKSDAEVFLSATNENIQLWKKENTYCEFIIQYLERNIAFIPLHKAKLLCYLHYMICFLKANYKDWRKKDPVPLVPEPYKQKLMDNFVLNRSMPQRMKDKMVAYAIVLSLMLHDYCFSYSAFASSTKLSAKRLIGIANALGCRVNENKNANIIELKLPLYKPRLFSKSKK